MISFDAGFIKTQQTIPPIFVVTAWQRDQMNEMSVHVDIGSDRFGRYTDLVYADLVMTFQRDASGNFWFWYAIP